MSDLLQAFRTSARSLAKSPGFTAVAVASLALGIGANTAIFSLVESVLLRPLPYREPDRLVVLWENNFQRHRDRNVVSPANFLDWKARNTVFEDMALSTWGGLTLVGHGSPERIDGRMVTGNLFSVLGVSPALGRSFRADEERGAAGPVPIVLSDALWKRRFGSDAGVLGRSVRTSEGSAVVVGVMPARFRPLSTEEYWEPFRFTPQARQHSGRYAVGWARMRRGVSAEAAQSAMSNLALEQERSYPDFDKGWGIQVVPMARDIVGDARSTLLILFATVTLVLLIACANLASLILSRAAGRRRELAIRQALGASHGRILEQALAEALLLSVGGGLAGLAVAEWGLHLLVAAAPAEIPRLAEVTLDTGALLFSLAVSISIGLVFGFLSAGRNRASLLADALGGSSSRATEGGRTARLRGTLAAAQIALALILTTGAGLVAKSLANLHRVDAGFDPQRVLTFRLILPETRYPPGPRQPRFFEELADRLRSLPGVRAVGVGSSVPLGGPDVGTSFVVAGRPEPPPGEKPVVQVLRIDTGYLSTLRVALVRGRGFLPADREGSPPVALVNRALVRQVFGASDPIGQRLAVDYSSPAGPVEIVGVVADTRRVGLDEEPRPTIYFAERQSPSDMMTATVRTDASPEALFPAVRETVASMDPELPLERVSTMERIVARSLGSREFPLYFLAPFSATALLLAAVGVYGVLALAVRQRLKEIGIRIALGARARDVIGLVAARTARIAGGGILLGAVGAFAATRFLRGILFGVAPADPLTFAAAAAAVGLVAILASVLPARRAARTDPIRALRQE